MVQYSFAQSHLIASKETTFDTAVTPANPIAIITNVSEDGSNSLIEVPGLSDREFFNLLPGGYKQSLTVDGTLNSGAVFEMFFGQVTTAATSTDITHTFIDHDGSETVRNTIDSFTLSLNHDSSTDAKATYAGCKINDLTINIGLDQVVNFSSTFFAASKTTTTTIDTRTVITQQPLTFAETTFTTGASTGTELTHTTINNFSITFSNGMNQDDIRGLGERKILELLPKRLTAEGSFTMKFQNNTEEERFLGGNSPQDSIADTIMIFQATNGTTLGSGRIEVNLKGKGQYESVNRVIAEDGVVEHTFNFRWYEVQDVIFVDQHVNYF